MIWGGSSQKHSRIQTLMANVADRVSDMMATEPEDIDDEISFVKAAEETGYPQRYISYAAACFDIDVFSRKAEPIEGEHRLSACISRKSLMKWKEKIEKESMEKGLLPIDLMSRKYLNVTMDKIPQPSLEPKKSPLVNSALEIAQKYGLETKIISEMVSGSLVLGDNPVEIVRERILNIRDSSRTIVISDGLLNPQTSSDISGIEAKKIVSALKRNEISSPKKSYKDEEDHWFIPSVSFCNWFNERFSVENTVLMVDEINVPEEIVEEVIEEPVVKELMVAVSFLMPASKTKDLRVLASLDASEVIVMLKENL